MNFTNHDVSWILKFIYSEKATKFCEIFPLLLTVCTVVKSKEKISQNFGLLRIYELYLLTAALVEPLNDSRISWVILVSVSWSLSDNVDIVEVFSSKTNWNSLLNWIVSFSFACMSSVFVLSDFFNLWISSCKKQIVA